MKKLFITTIMAMSLGAFAQVKYKNAPTTLEEYNYMETGYRQKVEMGLDVKEGYRIEDFYVGNTNEYHFEIKNLVRTVDQSSAGLIYIVVDTSVNDKNQRTSYYAIPINNRQLFNEFYKKTQDFSKPLLQAFTMVSTYLMSNYYFEKYN